jgi:hypothetical protein
MQGGRVPPGMASLSDPTQSHGGLRGATGKQRRRWRARDRRERGRKDSDAQRRTGLDGSVETLINR